MWEHFGCEFENFDQFEWLQIQLNDENRDFVINTLRKIHVPGEVHGDIAVVYGYGQNRGYINDLIPGTRKDRLFRYRVPFVVV